MGQQPVVAMMSAITRQTERRGIVSADSYVNRKSRNFEFIMNRAYALNRDKLKCRVCGGWLISSTPWAHRINPNLPLDKVNRVNNLVSLHKKCFMAVNNPSQDIGQFDGKAQKKIIGYREKLVISHTCNNQSASMERRVR